MGGDGGQQPATHRLCPHAGHRHRPSSPSTCCSPSSLVCSPPSQPSTAPASTVPPPPVPARLQLTATAAARHHQVPACSRHPVTARHGATAHLQSTVTDSHRWSAARRHRPSPRTCSCRPITARHRWSVARLHCSSPPACHYPSSHHHPHYTVFTWTVMASCIQAV